VAQMLHFTMTGEELSSPIEKIKIQSEATQRAYTDAEKGHLDPGEVLPRPVEHSMARTLA
jgi:hypothetical protein